MKFLEKTFYKDIYDVLRKSAIDFGLDKGMKLSASLAYYSIFSIAPLLLILIWLIGFIGGAYIENEGGAKSEIFQEFSELFGSELSFQLQQVIQKISIANRSGWGIWIGIGTLIIGSTSIFVEIQDSINTIWKVKPKPRKGWLKLIINRVVSFSMVIGFGFLLIASLIVNTIVKTLWTYINQFIPIISGDLVAWISSVLTFVIICILFGAIYSVLPDAKIRFKDALAGAIFTGLLFMVGKYFISLYLMYAAVISAYGAAGSIIILILWVYYSATILYFGAEFTKNYAEKYGKGVLPYSYSVKFVHQEIEIK